ncbi:hypothetical protein [Agromyces sp. Marseille-Q5079]|uniref:hypothetical protein n=1 Tax=Agromyces sp. Marseille-Q5079 TaxID=3439059 RepID=UPI003D9CA10D
MSLAYGYLAETMQSHDEREAARIHEQRLAVADRRAFDAERAARDGQVAVAGATPSRLHRLAERMHLIASTGDHQGARAAH